jgi:hypothetical protein
MRFKSAFGCNRPLTMNAASQIDPEQPSEIDFYCDAGCTACRGLSGFDLHSAGDLIL